MAQKGSIQYNLLTPSEAIVKKQEEVKLSFEAKEKLLKVNGVLLTSQRKEIIEFPFQILREKLKKGELKSLEVLQAFQAKALIETKKTCCVTEFIPEAETWAKERDSITAEKRGALHGLPVSIKENFDVKGMDTTLGLTKRLGKPLTKHSVLVQVMIRQGAVPFVKTNVPQLIYSVGCSNPIYGTTVNPHNFERSPGGSSGGEAALITGGGSVLGIGTDMMGSVRIPSAFCGTYGIKPTQQRISRSGCYGTFKSMIGVKNTSGFLGRDVEALAAGMEAVLADEFMSSIDPLIPHLFWNHKIYHSTNKLKIGWYSGDEILPLTPGISRALRLSKEALIKRGHEVVTFDLPDAKEVLEFGLDILLSEGGGAMLEHWEGGEIVAESVKFNKKVISAPSWVKYAMKKYYSYYSPLLAKMASHDAAYSSELWKAVARQKAYTDKLFELWIKSGIDVVVGPGFPSPAPHPKHHGTLMPACIYFGYSNLCDMPTGTMPITYENDEDQQGLKNYPEGDLVLKTIKETTRGAKGLPLCVQLGALPWKEELLLKAMKELEEGLREMGHGGIHF